MASVEHTSYLGEWANVGFPWSNTARTWGQSQNIDIYSISLEETAVAKDVREVFLRLPIGVQVHGSDALKKIPMNVLGDSVHLKDIRLHNASYKRVFVEDTQCRSSYRYASWADDMPWDTQWGHRDTISWGDNQAKVTKRLIESTSGNSMIGKSMSKLLGGTVTASVEMHRHTRFLRAFSTEVHCRYRYSHDTWLDSNYPWQLGNDLWSADEFSWKNSGFTWEKYYGIDFGQSEEWGNTVWRDAEGYMWGGKVIKHGLRWTDCRYGNDSIKVFKNLAETIGCAWSGSKGVYSITEEPVCVTDDMLRIAQFHRLFAKNTYVRTSLRNKVKRHHDCNVVVNDKRVHNSNAVISDIIVNNKDIPVDSPAGYSKWIPFISGDYTYKDALMKCEVKSEENATVVEIPEYKVFVDLPDIIDKGTVRLDEAREKFVPFNIEFYQEPTVTITAMSVDSSDSFFVPVCSAGRLDGFFVKLVGVDGKLKTGMISWQAVGV